MIGCNWCRPWRAYKNQALQDVAYDASLEMGWVEWAYRRQWAKWRREYYDY